jgi:hypothetical protein
MSTDIRNGSVVRVCPPRTITIGTTDTLLPNDTTLLFALVTPAALEVFVPAADVPSRRVALKDKAGNAGTHNITLTAQGCTIDGQSSFVLNVNNQAIELEWDGNSNWMVF